MFILQESPIDTVQAKKMCLNPANGAIVTFEGIVRADLHKGSTVSELLYIADTPACLTEGEKIIIEALSKFSITDAVCIQRIGQLKVAETAVWIGVWAGHRDEAFKGCRYIIEEIKKRLLIWKKEFYADGSKAWIHGHQTTEIKKDCFASLAMTHLNKHSHALLSAYTTFQLGGPCQCLIECVTPDELIQTVQKLKIQNTPFLLIGGGSNLVVSDHGLDTTVIRYLSPTPLIERTGNDITVAAGTVLDDLALYCVDAGLEGLNYTTGIPGTVGGAVVGNAGAWGKQVGDVLKSALILDAQGKTKTVEPDYFSFSYRHSRLKETDEIIVSVTFSLLPADPIALAQERAEILKKRAEKHPDMNTQPCAGSFFRNIEPTSKADRRQASGGFLEDAGAKNLKVGGAYVFEKHANIIIKGPGATAQDVHDLHLKMIDVVKEKFGLQLIREVRFAGKFNNTPLAKPEGFW